MKFPHFSDNGPLISILPNGSGIIALVSQSPTNSRLRRITVSSQCRQVIGKRVKEFLRL